MSACTATGLYAVAEGSGTTASGVYSHAEGYNTTASGVQSHAEGASTTASGNYSHAEGDGTSALTQSSHAEGGNTRASGSCSHAEGQSTTASGHNSHAEGAGTTASGWYSHAEGNGTSATTECEHASGSYNVSLSGSSIFGDSGNTLFTVGNGFTKSYTHNALQIMQNGDIYISDTSSEGKYYEKPMIKLQDALKNSGGDVDLQELINRISELETKVATLITKTEVEKGFNNVITVVDDTLLKIRNTALEDEGTD